MSTGPKVVGDRPVHWGAVDRTQGWGGARPNSGPKKKPKDPDKPKRKPGRRPRFVNAKMLHMADTLSSGFMDQHPAKFRA